LKKGADMMGETAESTSVWTQEENPGYNNQYPQTSVIGMTVGIAALCDNGQACVVCADREAQFNYGAFVLRADMGQKIVPIGNNCAVALAGEMSLAIEIIERAKPDIRGDGETILKVAETLQKVFMDIRQERAEKAFLKPGLTLEEFGRQVSTDIYRETWRKLFDFRLQPVHFLVVGTDKAGAHIYNLSASPTPTMDIKWHSHIGYSLIGMDEAVTLGQSSLIMNHQKKELELNRTLYNVYCAKRAGELSLKVGFPTDIAVITPASGIEFIDGQTITKLKEMRELAFNRSRLTDDEAKGLFEPKQKEKPS
jgi:hypothetical protein